MPSESMLSAFHRPSTGAEVKTIVVGALQNGDPVGLVHSCTSIERAVPPVWREMAVIGWLVGVTVVVSQRPRALVPAASQVTLPESMVWNCQAVPPLVSNIARMALQTVTPPTGTVTPTGLAPLPL